MAKFSGLIGYVDSVEDPPGSGVWEPIATERSLQGDILTNTRRFESGQEVNGNIVLSNRISVVADEYAIKHYFKIKYVRLEEVNWLVTTVEVQSPRLILSLGGVYVGPTA